MDILSIFGMAVGLAMDAFAVSVANGLLIRQLYFGSAFRIAFSFGLFQALMPVIGWAVGHSFRTLIQAYDHWVAFGLLAIIGVKMIIESRCLDDRDEEREKKDCRDLPTLLLLSVATSIDALAVGLSFAFLNVSIAVPAVIIGAITFALCLAGVYIGNRSGHFFEGKFELIGGIILVGIGVKIAVQHIAQQI